VSSAVLRKTIVATTSMKPPAFKSGALLAGKYRVEREIGAGGVGVVTLATHVELGQRVAIKYLRLSGATARGVERFKREALLAASLRSEHVVKVFDVGALPEGIPYIVMEYLEGEDLSQVLARGPIPIEQAVQWTLEACAALAEAHELGIVHRDLKPANLFLAKRPNGPPTVKILDFGISKITQSSSLPRLVAVNAAAMTQQHETFGTPYYMPPEQLVSSANVDARADIWAMGVCLYELLTGRLPFEGCGDDLRRLVAEVLACVPTPMRDHRREIPVALAEIVHGCLSYDPEQRPRSVAAFAERLRPFASAEYVRERAFSEMPESSGIHQVGWAHRASTPSQEPYAPPMQPRSAFGRIAAIGGATVALGAALALAFSLTRAPKPVAQSLVGVEPPRAVVVAPPSAPPSALEPARQIEIVEVPRPPPPPIAAPRRPHTVKPAASATAVDEFGDRR
jgi:serine/threonine-protein kinase